MSASIELILRIPYTSLTVDEDKIYYNHIHYNIKSSKMKYNRLVAVYDNVCTQPMIELLQVDDEGKVISSLYGQSDDEIDDSKLNTGGVYVDVFLYSPDQLLGEDL